MGGELVENNRIGSFESPITDMPIDGYALISPSDEDLGVIYLSPYHKRTSKMAPHGLRIITDD